MNHFSRKGVRCSHFDVGVCAITDSECIGHDEKCPRFDVSDGYGSAVIDPYSKDFRIGVIAYMKMLISLMEHARWLEKLRIDKRKY